VEHKLFYVDRHGQELTYSDLITSVNETLEVPKYCYRPDTMDVFLRLVQSLLYGDDLILLDSDFSTQELRDLGIEPNLLGQSVQVEPRKLYNVDHLIEAISNNHAWRLTLFTSGTTGLPKKVRHSLASLTRFVRKSPHHKDDVWGFAYNPTHIAGIQVFFQALLNGNTLVDLFRTNKNETLDRIEKYRISNISATPTFYRLLLPLEGQYPSVRRLTSGGERFDPRLSEDLGVAFPNAQLRNIYASTEAGSVLQSVNDLFTITDPTLCKIVDNQLHIHASLVGTDLGDGDWYNTGDLVEFCDDACQRFRFVSRVNEMINVGGYKVNPSEIETALCTHSSVRQAHAYAKSNSLVGNVLIADVVVNGPITERELRDYLRQSLQDFKIPRIINFVERVQTTRSGKLKRT
jgi:acyl-coenzyme A synthetase/AMP-(fatty) acid ligase